MKRRSKSTHHGFAAPMRSAAGPQDNANPRCVRLGVSWVRATIPSRRVVRPMYLMTRQAAFPSILVHRHRPGVTRADPLPPTGLAQHAFVPAAREKCLLARSWAFRSSASGHQKHMVTDPAPAASGPLHQGAPGNEAVEGAPSSSVTVRRCAPGSGAERAVPRRRRRPSGARRRPAPCRADRRRRVRPLASAATVPPVGQFPTRAA